MSTGKGTYFRAPVIARLTQNISLEMAFPPKYMIFKVHPCVQLVLANSKVALDTLLLYTNTNKQSFKVRSSSFETLTLRWETFNSVMKINYNVVCYIGNNCVENGKHSHRRSIIT